MKGIFFWLLAGIIGAVIVYELVLKKKATAGAGTPAAVAASIVPSALQTATFDCEAASPQNDTTINLMNGQPVAG
jgi:hypothetical protein